MARTGKTRTTGKRANIVPPGNNKFIFFFKQLAEYKTVFDLHVWETFVFMHTALEKKNWPRGYKTVFMLNSTEHEICPAHKC